MISIPDVLWFSAGLCAVCAFVALTWPWALHAASWVSTPARKWPAVGTLMLAAAACIISAQRMNSNPLGSRAATVSAGHDADSLQGALRKLEARLRSGGGTATDWSLLAQTYEYLGRHSDAEGARSRHVVAGVPPVDTLVEAVAADLLKSAPAATGSPDAAARLGAVHLSGEVTLVGPLSSKVPAGMTLFIVARSLSSPGAPVAVLRTRTGAWPISFRLDDSLAMLPDRKLSTAGRITVEARISQSGTAASEPGDFASQSAAVDIPSDQAVHLVIDHILR